MPKVPKVVVVKNPDGSFSSERTTSVSHAALNKGRETLIPTLIEGKQFSVPDATKFATESGLEFPSFDSPKKATAFAAERSRTGGATKHGFLGKSKMPKRKKAFSELSKENQIARASTALQAAQKKAFAAEKGSPEAEGHFKARAAASRVLSRLRGKTPSRDAVTKPGKKKTKGKSTPESRREPFEKGTGVGPGITDKLPSVANKLRGINDLISAGRKKKGK